MTRLTAIDATFLELEELDDAAHMHIGAVLEFEPAADRPPPTIAELRAMLEARSAPLARYRQRLSEQHTGGLDWPAWVADENFDISRHVRHATLPAPGGDAELTEWAADYWSHRLDRTAPLWEVTLVDGLASGGFALVTKTHHCMVDGVGSVDIAHVLFDASPDGGESSGSLPAPVEGGEDRHIPGWLHWPAHVVVAGAHAGAHVALHPRDSLHRSRTLADVLVRSEINAAPATSLNVPIGGRRRFATVDADLADVRAIARTAGVKINDVVLSVVAGALGRLLTSRGEETPLAGLRAMVPVNIRAEEEHDGRLGNRVSSMFIDLPVAVADPVARLLHTHRESSNHKAADQALGSSTMIDLTSLAPPVLHASIARTLYATRLFNVTVTNVPGPQVPLYAFGARMKRVMPLVPLASAHCVGVAIVSYDGRMTFGLIGDYGTAGDLDVLRMGLAQELDALKAIVSDSASAA